MKRDTVKTLAGLVIIGGIVVATFLYGNYQRQAQLAHDQDVKKQQTANSQAVTNVSPTASVAPTQTATPTPTPAAPANQQVASNTNTAPVKSPTSNSIQGSGSGASLGTATTASPAAVPATGAASGLPQTGPEMMGAVGLGSIVVMIAAVRGSRKAMLDAARARR